jgi:hypothetical protein
MAMVSDSAFFASQKPLQNVYTPTKCEIILHLWLPRQRAFAMLNVA